ncbi:MAG: C4-dicarboxylic acid transporter DauA [Pseudomonadota bacterium]
MPRLPATFVEEFSRLPIAHALREVFREGYDARKLRRDLVAGATVAIVALPLSMALAIATGVPPQHGLYTAIVAGAFVAALGGSRFQVTGPTAAFIVVLAPVVSQYGLAGLLTAGLLAGLMLIAMGVARLGRLIEFIPHPVTTGFTAGIATVIFVLQLKDALGLQVEALPEHFPEKVAALFRARGTVSLPDVATAAITLLVLLGLPRLTRRLPAPLFAVAAASASAALLNAFFPEFDPATVGSRFQSEVNGQLVPGIPRAVPMPGLPWEGTPLTLDWIRQLLPPAFTIAILAAIESLLSAVIADGMTGTRHEPNSELVALGIGNVAAPLFGGIPATGALARTATNVRAGAVSPVASIIHALGVLVAMLVAAPLVAYVPMASLAALLMVVAWNMSEARHAAHILKVAPKSDAAVLLACYGLTVFFDMVIAVSFGVLLAALLFTRRMAELTQSRLLGGSEQGSAGARDLPPHVAVYEIAGPLFFGAAQRGMAALDAIGTEVRVVVLDLGRVPAMDASGLVALESALGRLHRMKKFAILSGPFPEPRSMFVRAELERHHENIAIASDRSEALEIARDLVLLNPHWLTPSQSAPKSASPAP